MDLSRTIVPKSDQLNFEDVQSQCITAVVKSVRQGNKEQPVFIDLEGYEGRPYKPSKSMRRVLIGGWGNDGHSWAGKSLTLTGDPTVKYGGVAVGGIKISAMSDISDNFSLMLTTSRGKRSEHRVRRLEVNQAKTEKISDPQVLLSWFAGEAGKMDLPKLEAAYSRGQNALAAHPDCLNKLTEMYNARKSDIAGA